MREGGMGRNGQFTNTIPSKSCVEADQSDLGYIFMSQQDYYLDIIPSNGGLSYNICLDDNVKAVLK